LQRSKARTMSQIKLKMPALLLRRSNVTGTLNVHFIVGGTGEGGR
jgi:hypothetical protein